MFWTQHVRVHPSSEHPRTLDGTTRRRLHRGDGSPLATTIKIVYSVKLIAERDDIDYF